MKSKLTKSQLKEIITEVVLESLNEEDYEHEANQGRLWGLKDRANGRVRDISTMPRAFQKAYYKAYKDPLWQRINNRITDFLGRMGSSRLRQ